MEGYDSPPEFTGPKPSEFKKNREKVRRWLLFTRTPAQLQGPHVLSKLTSPSWYACDELEPEDVATADGVNMILDTLAEALQDEYDVDGPHTAHVSQVKEALIEQDEDIELEIALAALEQEGDTDLEETDVQEIPQGSTQTDFEIGKPVNHLNDVEELERNGCFGIFRFYFS